MSDSPGTWGDREKNIYKAKVAEQAERYEEMVHEMTAASKLNGNLSVEERNLLSVAYKNVVGAKRASWRILSALELKKNEEGKNADEAAALTEYKKKIEQELDQVCDKLLVLIDEELLKDESQEAEATVFYLKMKGDYFRYKAEFAEGEAEGMPKWEAKKGATDAYTDATNMATKLQPTHPIRLGLALNFSVFHYEINGKSDQACTLAKSAFDDAIAELDTLSEESYKDATLIMQLLRDNLTLWTSDDGGGDQNYDAGDGTQVTEIND